MTLRHGIPMAAGGGALGLRRGLIRCGAVALLSFGLLGCSTLSDLGSLFSDEAESPESVAKADKKAKEGFPTLQDVPANPPPATSPEEREEIREGLVADRKKARYTDERLRAPLSDRPAAPPSPPTTVPAAPAAPVPAVAKEAMPTPAPSASASVDTSKPVAPPQAPKYVEPPKAPAPPKAPPAGASAPSPPVTSTALKSEKPSAKPAPPVTATPMIAMMTRGAAPTPRGARGLPEARTDLPASTRLTTSPSVDRSALPRAPDPTMTTGAAAPTPVAPTVTPTPAAPAAPTAAAPDPAMSAPASTAAQATGRPPATTVVASGNVLQDTFDRQMQASAAPRFAAAGPANQTPQPPRSAAADSASAATTGSVGNDPVTILFADGSSKLSAADRRTVRGLAEQYRTRGGYLRVVGHASSRTRQMSVEQHMLTNFSISLARGQAVAEALAGQGVDSSAIVVEAKGDAEPRFFEAMPSGAARNRRVEIFLEN